MHSVTLRVNGAPVTAQVEPRMHLADFLREHCLLTGTHIGCEHGVCGACTVLLDGAPARACIAFAAACAGGDVRSIEGLQDDPIMRRLRAAFTAEHALQCGYCTPGMLVTARDIVLRLPQADDACIRQELAGNLCRCTGYAGIVRAIRRVLAEHADVAAAAPPAEPVPRSDTTRWEALGEGPQSVTMQEAPRAPAAATAQPGSTLTLAVMVNRPRAEVWAALQDPVLLAACVPGARLTQIADGRIAGEMQVALGAITALFAGAANLALDAAAQRATLSGEGRDTRSGTHLSGAATITLESTGSGTTRAVLDMTYALRGPLTPLARGPVMQALAAGIADTVARNLERRLAGETDTIVPPRLSAGRLLLHIVRQWLRRWLHRT